MQKIFSAQQITIIITIMLPSIISIIFIENINSKIATVGCILQLPASLFYHCHTILNSATYHKIIKINAIMTHIYLLFIGYAWFLTIGYLELFYHMWAIYYIVKCPTITHAQQNIFNIICVLGTLISTFGLFHKNRHMYNIYIFFWFAKCILQNEKFHHDAIGYIIISIQQYYIMQSAKI